MLVLGPAPVRDPSTSATNWLDAPHNRWAAWHTRELCPTQRIAAGLPQPLLGAAEVPDLGAVPVTRGSGETGTVGDVLADSFTDAFLVLKDGALVSEAYATGGGPSRPHAVLSVTKSVVGAVAGVLVDRGVLDDRAPVTRYVPELAAYDGATVRHLLDMRSGVRFVEDYEDPDGDIHRLDRWIAGDDHEPARGLYEFLTTLEAERDHGGAFRYRSAETDALGWVCERAAGVRMADLVSELVWGPMGAEHDADLICDAVGTGIHDGGLCATARDLARFGQLMLTGGVAADGTQVVPGRWVKQGWAVDADVRQAFLDSPAEVSFPGGWYRNQLWFHPGSHGDVLLCLGIHGQLLHVSRRTGTVCVKLSSWPRAQDPGLMRDTLRACEAVGGALAHRESTGDVHRLPGVVAGVRRRGGSIV